MSYILALREFCFKCKQYLGDFNGTPQTVMSDLSTDEWARLPKAKERLYGLSRATLLNEIAAGHVMSAVLRRPGAKRAIRLVNMPSLRAFLQSCIETSARAKVPDSLQ